MDGLAVGMIALGGLMVWSGVDNQKMAATLKSVVSGQTPTPGPGSTISVTPPAPAPIPQSGTPQQEITSTTPGAGNATQNQALGKLMAGGYKWYPGAQWTALNDVIERESGWLANARNPSSGAYGIGQAYGHGTAATAAYNSALKMTINEYGPDYGVSVATAKAANAGSAQAQIAWTLAYIHGKYGTPSAAWASEESVGAY